MKKPRWMLVREMEKGTDCTYNFRHFFTRARDARTPGSALEQGII